MTTDTLHKLENYAELLAKTTKEITLLINAPYNKARSKRIRALSLQLGKDGVKLRSVLVDTDKSHKKEK